MKLKPTMRETSTSGVLRLATLLFAAVFITSTTTAFGLLQQQPTTTTSLHTTTTCPKSVSPSSSWRSNGLLLWPPSAPPRGRPSSFHHLFSSSSSSIETNDEVKDPSTLVSARDDSTQQLSFVLISGGILAGSVVFLNLYDFLETALPPPVFEPFYTVLPCVLSSLFIAAGIAHFALEDTFTAFVPPKGSWGGLWRVPSPGAKRLGLTYEQYHSFWSGIAEILAGASLIVATTAAGSDSDVSSSAATTAIPAGLMWILTAAVTPANIYMYTHNPVVPRIPALTYPWGHAGRGLLQCALLGVFSKLTIHSIS